MNRHFFLSILLFISSAAACASERDVWLLVDTGSRELRVMEGDDAKEVFDHIAIGSKGAGFEKMRDDNKTPLGEYRIGWVNDKSKYHRFFGMTYPNSENAKRAYQDGLIGEEQFNAIVRASLADSVPPQNTPLGGQIGIHGLGAASLAVHENFDWTHGCIAMTNQQIDRLSQWVKKGTLVVIR
ncbi:murein L,D-transpeptidase family protein [Methylococcus sp. EFPC2]|uniref:L,D-transpeptidase family protein n=1 Tax=Methylococcus sp. EFPC2 TaxID=2812648 RepID=UPI001967786B|nr:L,D-transpeptidase [Methylococcus sp. EFPC2]QSA95806.1 L,D-transpeptidase [Methylococcus sp. EFPC2]